MPIKLPIPSTTMALQILLGGPASTLAIVTKMPIQPQDARGVYVTMQKLWEQELVSIKSGRGTKTSPWIYRLTSAGRQRAKEDRRTLLALVKDDG